MHDLIDYPAIVEDEQNFIELDTFAGVAPEVNPDAQ